MCEGCEEGFAVVEDGTGVTTCNRADPCEEADACAGHARCVFIKPLHHACFCNIGYAG